MLLRLRGGMYHPVNQRLAFDLTTPFEFDMAVDEEDAHVTAQDEEDAQDEGDEDDEDVDAPSVPVGPPASRQAV